ncbi:CP24A protein, partial [Polyodon spathula]|nr:CP24A protein [Polyodon spathula]
MLEYHKQYGDIFKMKIGNFESVQIGHPILLEKLFRNESQFPQRLEIRPWKAYRDYREESYGLLTLEGEEWIAVRRHLPKQLLKPNQIEKCHVMLNEVIENLITQIDSYCDENRCMKDIMFELNKWTFQSTCSLFYNKKVGLEQPINSKQALTFIMSSKQMMQCLGILMVTSADLHKKVNSKIWKQHTEAWDNLFEIGKVHESSILKGIHRHEITKTNHPEEDILDEVYQSSQLSRKQLYAVMTELQTGGVETTANAMLWAIFNLSRNPQAQARLNKEVLKVLPDGQAPTVMDINKIPFLKACLKESMRVTPTIPFTSRTLDKDTCVGGYLLPKNVFVMINAHPMNENEEYFSDAKLFKPERWLQEKDKIHPFANCIWPSVG